MPDATITSTASTFGTISGVFSADQSTISGTISGIIPGTLTGSVGVPGPAGPAGIGLPAGGTSGQFLQKTSGVDYATDWVTVNLTGLATESWVTAGFYPLTGNPSSFLTASALTPYLTSATAASTYQTLSGMSDYLAKAGNLAGLANTGTARTNLGLGSLAVVNDAPSDGSQYARKNAAWDVVIPGDRYLTTSTTSNTVSNGNKTFTIGTGLSYTPTQNITISYNASNHMHGEVLTYNSGTGVLTVDVNHHTGSGTYTAWVVNVGGVTPATSVAWGTVTGTLSAQTDLQSALDLKLAATTAASTYQTLAGMSSYLTTSTASTTYALKTNGELKGNFTLDGTAASPNSDGSILIGSLSSGYSYLNLAAGDIQGRTFSGTGSSFQLNGTSGLQLFTSGQGVRFPDTSVQTVAYPGSSGFLLKADNLSGLANTGTARTNLGLGTMAVETASNYLTTASASSTYFTIANAANKADLASPTFTGTPSLPTGTTAVTQTTGNNTTAIATTAFVQQEVPAASTTAAGKVELATVDEALRPSSSTLGMTPDTTREMLMYPGYINLFGGGNVATSGTGAYSTFTFATQRWHAMRSPNATVAGYGMYIFDYSFSGIGMAAMTRGSSSLARKWNNKIWLSGRTVLGQSAETTSGLNGDANCTARVMLGGRASAGTGGMQSSDAGIGWRVAGGGSVALVMTVSTGSVLTETTSSFTPVLGQVFDWKMYSDGTGNVTLWVNDSQVATSTGGPTTSTAETTNFYCEVVEQTASAATPFGMGNFGSKVFWSQA
jgi:hypothetical protein